MADITKEYLALRDQYIESRFARLNPVQRQAVFATEGPLLILAGAGSGKTTVLVNRIANIIRFGSAHGSTELPRPVTEADLNDLRNAVAAGRDLPRETAYLAVRPARPWNVLAITFTNKAAGELKERLRAMLGDTLGGDVNASTFHSACVRMLRRDAERIGFPKSFTIYDSDDQQRVIKQIYKDLMIDDKFLPVKSAIGQISSFKDKLLSAEDVAGEPFANTKAQLVSKIYTAYAGRLKAAGAMDFDDLIFHTVKLLQNDAEAREYYQNRFRYVVVDEYQDTSIAQFHLVRLLAGGYLQLAVAQSDMAQDAYDGSGIFSHESTERSFSAVAALYEEAVQVIVRADSGITTLEELQGCTLSVGEEESGSEQNAWQVLAACGLNNRLVHTVNLNYTDAAAQLADGTIDAMFVTAGLHADALEQLAETCAIRLLSVDGGVGARLLAAYPAYRACVIPAGTYAGQGEDVWTVSVQALLLASNALSDETVQRLTARYFDSVDAVAAAVPVPLVTDPAVAAAQGVIPYHAGAAAYYTAQGITPAGPETGASPEQEAAA